VGWCEKVNGAVDGAALTRFDPHRTALHTATPGNITHVKSLIIDDKTITSFFFRLKEFLNKT
jgi:hypothetical protein